MRKQTPADEAFQEQHIPQLQYHDGLSEKKIKSTLRTWEQPLWPPMAKTLFLCFVFVSAAMSLVEMKNYALNHNAGILLLLKNVSLDLFILWILLLTLESVCCILNSMSIKRSFYKRKAESGIIDSSPEDQARSKRALRKQNAPCRQYVKISATVSVFFTLLHLILQLLNI